MGPVATLAGPDPVRTMYAIRIVGALLVAIMAVLAATLAVQWFGRDRPEVPAAAALIVAFTPNVTATARVTNDGLVALVVTLGLVAAMAFAHRPTTGRAAVFGIVTAGAVLTKSPGVLLLPVAMIVLAVVWPRGQLRGTTMALILVPGLLAWLAWAGFTYRRYGVFDGALAFRAMQDARWEVVPLSKVLWELWKGVWASASTRYAEVEGIRWVGRVIFTGALGVAIVGFARRPRPALGIALTAVVLVGLVTMIRIGNLAGLNPPIARVLVPALPALAALIAGAWGSRLGARAALIPAGALGAAAILLRAAPLLP
jgi:4-amino-4-deoxy-L-arabinose transferase-like glycosyltransferase